jgi:hypothetical protein
VTKLDETKKILNQKWIIKYKSGYYILKEFQYSKKMDVKIINIYVSNNRPSKFMKENRIEREKRQF